MMKETNGGDVSIWFASEGCQELEVSVIRGAVFGEVSLCVMIIMCPTKARPPPVLEAPLRNFRESLPGNCAIVHAED